LNIIGKAVRGITGKILPSHNVIINIEEFSKSRKEPPSLLPERN
jgi:hypothetical protein